MLTPTPTPRYIPPGARRRQAEALALASAAAIASDNISTETAVTNDGSQPKRPLYLDAMNYANVFFPSSEEFEDHEHQVCQMLKNVSAFTKAAKNSGYELFAFFNVLQNSTETEDRWFQYHESEITNETKKKMPDTGTVLLSDAFNLFGVEVFYSIIVESDDALAFQAEKTGGIVLSMDSDFHRYRDSTFSLYGHFEIIPSHAGPSQPLLKLDRFIPNPKKLKALAKKDLLSRPPELSETIHFTRAFLQKGRYRRGAGTRMIKVVENPHFLVRPLRKALYARCKEAAAILESNPETKYLTLSASSFDEAIEILPSWDQTSQSVVWSNDIVTPDASLDSLLDDPQKAFDALVPSTMRTKPNSNVSDTQWKNHLFSIRTLIYDLCRGGLQVKPIIQNGNNPNLVNVINIKTPTLFDLLKQNYPTWQQTLTELIETADDGVTPLTRRLDSLKIQQDGLRLFSTYGYKFKCRDCRVETGCGHGEMEFLKVNGYDIPFQCAECRYKRKEAGYRDRRY
ncbi:hypothetical protein HDU76_013233 [Blyttiomyces sp. JEL0837]|nr:hypothetical protein HDU76_013233 [Blyttiomyces sp. JEL0837]